MESTNHQFWALEFYIRAQLTNAGRNTDARDQVNLDTLVEEADATVCRMVAERIQPDQWLYFRIPTVSTLESNAMMATEIAPALQELKDDGCVRGWWWLNKNDICGNAVRLRIEVLDRTRRQVESAVKTRLEGFRRQLTMLRYEPELRLFGGPLGIRIAHNLFCADSEFLSKWMKTGGQGRVPVIPEGLSLALILRLLRAAGLDVFEIWDVFDRVCAKRPSGRAWERQAPAVGRVAEKLLRSTSDSVFDLYEDRLRALLREYCELLDSLGHELSRNYFEGHLECGVREFLAPVILFHWNRIGMPGVVQSALCYAVAGELAGLSRKGATRREGAPNT